MTDKEEKIILAYADNDMLISKTAASLSYHHNTICYHLDKIKRKYNLDPSQVLLFSNTCKQDKEVTIYDRT